MYQVDWQEYEDVQEFSSTQYKELYDALRSYHDKIEKGYSWVKLSQELMEHYNPEAETFKEKEENWEENGGFEKQTEALINSFGIDDNEFVHCNTKMVFNHYVDENSGGRIYGYTCFECGYSKWNK